MTAQNEDVTEDPQENDEDTSQESEEDATGLSEATLRAFVTGSDWTTETLLGQLRRGNINLNPSFQRREVWGPERKSRFIESVLLNLPIPQIVLAERQDSPNTFIVLDGKQRLLTLRQFCSSPAEFPEDEAFPPLRLRGLTLLKELRKSSYSDLVTDPDKSSYRNAFDNHTIRTVVIRNWPSEDFLFMVFLRLNTGSVQLSPQELRQALLPGPFIEFADQRAIDSASLHRALRTAGPDYRMRDTELFVRFCAFRDRAEQYRGNLKQFLDETCRLFNAEWSTREKKVLQLADSCDAAIDATFTIFGDDAAFRRYREGQYEAPFNRAVFDVMTYYFSAPKIARVATRRKARVRSAFEKLCETDAEFVSSVSATTKSLEATRYRWTAWADRLSQAIDQAVQPPEFRPRQRRVRAK